LIHSISQIFVQAQSNFSLFSQLDPSWSSWKYSLELLCSTPFWAIVLTSCFECVITRVFECVVTRITDRLGILILCKGPSSISVKTLFNISAQPQLLEVEGPGDVGIVKAELRYILCSYFIFTFIFSHFFDLNCILLPLHLNIKPQIGLYISTLGSLHSCTILTFQYHHLRAFKGLSIFIIWVAIPLIYFSLLTFIYI
jgi:hypothetical protein